ncbi:MAG: hypothetical protein VX473_01485 [Candidatus Thermoplasmatota archaeon]|nr:hypothetical protein [Candidatus Thermoplasmatota archaeon]
MTGILVDACGWVAIVDARINIDLALESQVGPVELKVTEAVMGELERLAKRESRTMLLDLLGERAEIVSGDGKHTDDELINLSTSQGWPVLTVDKALKARLHNANASVIEVHGKNALRLIQ